MLPLFIDDLVLDELLSERVEELSGRFTMSRKRINAYGDHSTTLISHTVATFNDV